MMEFKEMLRRRVLALDGATGTMIQRLGLTEADYRGSLFREFRGELKGNNDLLSVTRPDAIAGIHRAYIDAGADIISTNSFNANAVSLADYGLADRAAEINRAAASVARAEADEGSRRTGRRIFVAGSMGPTNRAASMSPTVEDPAARNVTFDILADAYETQATALAEGGVDLFLIETAYDAINLKGAIEGTLRAMRALGREIPVMVSVTVADKGGHILSGQSLEAVVTVVESAPEVVSLGLNCSFGPKEIIPHLQRLAEISPLAVSCHPNAGHPDELGRYLETPESFTEALRPEIEAGRLNIVGGCCGTTPEHIAALAALCRDASPRPLPEARRAMVLSGLEPLDTRLCSFIVVGERCNVAGSRKFLRLIKENNFEEALRIAAKQVADGAMVIDINMDDPLLDAPEAMERFLRLAGADPEIAKVPFMIDTSFWSVAERALKNIQGKCIVNSISLKEGEEEFLRKARFIRDMGAAVVVMAFDEEGQAATYERKTAICGRAYRLLTEKAGFNPYDIIFDPNIMAVATGVPEHNLYARDFIRATEWIRSNLPGAKVSGGVSNLSFAFRGKNSLREAMHCVFLHHARLAGMEMAIVNPASLLVYEEIEPRLRQLLDDVILFRRPEAAEELAEFAMRDEGASGAGTGEPGKEAEPEWRQRPVTDRLRHSVIKGISEFLNEDIAEALAGGTPAASLIEGPLMEAMEHVGELFGEGKMFLPQVVKTARTMKRAVEILRPAMERENSAKGAVSAGKILFATVKGDVHDIGKNIVEIVLECNNYEVVDLGVMVPAETIVEEAIRQKPDLICLSGLITPSLGEMTHVAESLEKAGLRIPLVVGGAATSKIHTALKISPAYSAPVVHARDAAQNPVIAANLLNPQSRGRYERDLREEQERLRCQRAGEKKVLPIDEARRRGLKIDWTRRNPHAPEIGTGYAMTMAVPLAQAIPFINWNFLFMAWRVAGAFLKDFPYGAMETEEAAWLSRLPETDRAKGEEALGLYHDALDLLEGYRRDSATAPEIRAMVRFEEANAEGDDIAGDGWRLPMLRSQSPDGDGHCLSLADMVIPAAEGRPDYIGFFCVSVSKSGKEELLEQTLRDRLAEAASEWLHAGVREDLWGYAPDERLTPAEMIRERYEGIRPAVGYPALPDQLLIKRIAEILPIGQIGVELTGNGAMTPSSTVCGLYLSHPDARYFTVDAIGDDQLQDYASRTGVSIDRLQNSLLSLLPSQRRKTDE